MNLPNQAIIYEVKKWKDAAWEITVPSRKD